ncbi:MAG: DNA repair and recombination protein RadB [Euryarchaeota archaeon]|nr:DNA repair and recombination protein RadB [Euryarchaeota archaeon]
MSEDALEEYRTRSHTWRLESGCVVDTLLGGGVESGTITQFYGPAGVGKTNLCLMYAVGAVRAGRRVVFIDTEGGHSLERVRQIAGEEYARVVESVQFYEARTFEEQDFIVQNVEHVIDDGFGLIVLDSAVNLYRLDRSDEKIGELNRRLSRQMAKLMELARRHCLAVIITNQVYSSEQRVEPVAGDVLRYWSKAIVELRKLNRVREAVLKRHRSLPEGLSVRFVIEERGIREI